MTHLKIYSKIIAQLIILCAVIIFKYYQKCVYTATPFRQVNVFGEISVFFRNSHPNIFLKSSKAIKNFQKYYIGKNVNITVFYMKCNTI